MAGEIQQLHAGAATVTVINIGDLHVNLPEWIKVPERDWAPRYTAAFTQPLQLPIYCIHVGLPSASVLVDASYLDLPADAPPILVVALAASGIQPEAITHVVITHGHDDHYNATTWEHNGSYVPRFPNARHYLGRADWEAPWRQEALRDPTSMQSRTLGVLDHAGLLQFVEGDYDLGHGVRIVATPGETPGHQIVHIQSAGETLYCVGDLYHHLVEIEQPTWMVHWADPETNRASREAFVRAALAEGATVIATHIPVIGRLQQTESGVTLTDQHSA